MIKEISPTTEDLNLNGIIYELEEKNEELSAQQEELQAAVEALLEKNNRLNSVLKELSERNFEMDQLIYRTSHDLRSPISSILGILHLLNQKEDQELAEYLQHIQTKVSQLDTTVQSLVNFSKSTKDDLKYEPVDLKKLFAENIQQLDFIPAIDNISIKIIEQLPEINFISDQQKLSILIKCIVSNAIHFQGKSKANELRILLSGDDHQVKMEFHDNGRGISEQVLDKVTDMFFRGNMDSKGAGMGLYIAKKIVEKLNGEMIIESKEGFWTKIGIKLPVKNPDNN